eukprot:2916982-Prymnesium_polylepis.1
MKQKNEERCEKNETWLKTRIARSGVSPSCIARLSVLVGLRSTAAQTQARPQRSERTRVTRHGSPIPHTCGVVSARLARRSGDII